MSPDAEDRAAQDAADAAALKALGYTQQLRRSMGGFENFALAFSVISVLTGAVTLYGHGLKFGGPLVMLVGWPLVALGTLTVAFSLAQLASAFPTAGALYHWASTLGGPGLGYFTAWLNTLGQFAITAAIDYGLAEFLSPMLGWPADRAHVLPLYALVLFSHGALNHVGVRTVARLNTVSAWYHLAGVAVLLLAVGVLAPKQDLGFLLTAYNHEGKSLPLGFAVGLLQAAWTFTGYDASAHVTEETVDPARNAPRGIVLSVVVSALTGWALVLAVTLAIQDLPSAAAATNPFIHVLTLGLGRFGAGLIWLVMGAMWFCGLSSVTSNSRMLFAFARDGGLPFSKALSQVSARFSSPHVAIWASVAAALLVALWSDAYSVMAALSTVALYVSYGLPIAAGLWAQRRGRWTTFGPWSLGRHSQWLNAVAVLWVLVMTALMSLPPNLLAGGTLLGTVLVLAVAWFGWMRTRFRGPPPLTVR